MGREQIKWSLIWRGDHVSLKGAHTQGNRTSEGLVGPLKRVWGPGGLGSIIYSCVTSNMSPPSFLTPRDLSLKHR